MFNYTLCIPRVCKTVTKNTIYDVLNNYKFGKIKKVQIIENKNKNCNIIHIHYCYWFNNRFHYLALPNTLILESPPSGKILTLI